jgi:hypothetical protein
VRRLYHFVDLHWGLDDIYRKRVKLSEFDLLNDPAELRGVKLPDENIMRFMIDNFRAEHGLVSMSNKWENPLLWSHYADKHKGLCFGFDINDDDDGVWDVTYKLCVETLDCHDLLREIADIARMPGHKTPSPDLVARFNWITKAILSTKFQDWHYEDEARVITTLETRENDVCYKQFGDQLQLREVILGSRCTLTKTEMESILKCHFDSVVVRKARQNLDSFLMEEEI